MANLSRLRDWGLLISCNLVWGCQVVIYKIVQQQSGPVFAALFPITIATLLMVPIVWRQHQKVASDAGKGLLPVGDVLQFLLIGICGQVLAQVGVATGARLTLASNAALLALALPVMTALMAFIFLNERMTPVRWVSFVLAVAGVLVCAGIRWGELSFTSTRYLLGNAIFFVAIAASAFYNAYSKRLLRRYSALEVLFYSYVVVVVFMLPVALYTEPHTFRSILNFRLQVWLGFFSLAILQYFFAMLIFLTVLTRMDATQAGLSNYLIPLFGVLAAVIVLGERFTANMVVGGLLVLCGTLLVTLYEGRQAPQVANGCCPTGRQGRLHCRQR